MAKLVNYSSGPISPDPNQPPAITGRKEVVVTPEPKTKAQRQANAKAQRLVAATKRQEENAHASVKLSKWQKKARRKRIRDIHYKAVQADLKSGAISFEQAKKLLPKRQNSSKDE
jgi:hypothetical protein